MKNASLSYHKTFPWTPMSGWSGGRRFGWVQHQSASGQWKAPEMVPHPFCSQLKLWCLLTIHIDGIDLIFATPRELEHFTNVVSQNPLPSGKSLDPSFRIGTPNKHWLSRLPAKSKSKKMRDIICGFIFSSPVVEEFLRFYQATEIRYDFEGYFDSILAAKKAVTLTK